MKVKDVAERKGQGTASLGLTRSYLLIAGPGADGSDDVLLEIKRTRRSALTGLVSASDCNSPDADPATDVQNHHGVRVANAHQVAIVNPGVFMGRSHLTVTVSWSENGRGTATTWTWTSCRRLPGTNTGGFVDASLPAPTLHQVKMPRSTTT